MTAEYWNGIPLTEWYPPEVKPVRVGEYHCQNCCQHPKKWPKHFWSGDNWWWSKYCPTIVDNLYWRGLARKP